MLDYILGQQVGLAHFLVVIALLRSSELPFNYSATVVSLCV